MGDGQVALGCAGRLLVSWDEWLYLRKPFIPADKEAPRTTQSYLTSTQNSLVDLETHWLQNFRVSSVLGNSTLGVTPSTCVCYVTMCQDILSATPCATAGGCVIMLHLCICGRPQYIQPQSVQWSRVQQPVAEDDAPLFTTANCNMWRRCATRCFIRSNRLYWRSK